MEYDALTKATQWAVEMRALQLTSAHRKPAVELEPLVEIVFEGEQVGA